MATTTPKTLVHTQPTAAGATVYTTPGATVTVVRHMRCTNKDSSSHTLELFRNGSAAANALTEVITIPAGGAWEDDVYIALAATDTIYAKADADSKITLYIGGAEIA
jgi:hypothetical protein